MKILIIDICIWILRKFKVSVIIGMDVGVKDQNAYIHAKYNIGRWYDCNFNCLTYTPKWVKFEIPHKAPFKL